MFYFEGVEKPYKSTCSSTSECLTSMVCDTFNLCNCSTGTFWNGTYCGNIYNEKTLFNFKLKHWYFFQENTRTIGQSCAISEGIYSNLACSSNLTCVTTGDTAGVCYCGPLYYFSTYCLPRKSINVTCASTSECRTDLGLLCNTVSNMCT